MKFSSNRQVDSAKNLGLKNSFPIHIANLDMKPKSSQAYKSHGAAGSNRKKGSNDSVSSDASVVTLKASNKVNTRRVMNPEQLQAFRMMRDSINDTQRSVLEPLLQALLNVNQNEEGRSVVFHCIDYLLNSIDRTIVTEFLEGLRSYSPRALAEAMHLLRDGFLGEILLEENAIDDEDIDEEVNIINNEERIESDIDLTSETSSLETFNISPFSNVPFNPDHIFDEEKSNA